MQELEQERKIGGNGDEGGEVLAGDGAVGVGCEKEKKWLWGWGEKRKIKSDQQGGWRRWLFG